MSLPQVLIDFATACGTRFGVDAAGHNDSGAFVQVGDRVVHINLDPNANRAVVWTELQRPERAAIEALERAAMDYTGRALLEKGLAIGVNRAADLILLGRSLDQEALNQDAGLDAVADLAKEAQAASAALAAVSESAANGAAGLHS